ncbi:MAG: TetR/AcrR family transcriptional regulator [Alphaproteobacteria bacterium]|nr:TetR/AcrR family transcriptional regulator [Alphaproteobacteria bacterium]
MVDIDISITPQPDRRPARPLRDPERTRARLLEAARREFSEHGLSGARVSSITASAGVNKQLLYYYFGDKESLYAEVIERAYADLRLGEQALELDRFSPREAMERFIEFNFDYLAEHRYFVALLNDENIHKARHIRKSEQLAGMHERLGHTIGAALKRGLADGTFKRAIDPVELYISIASLCFFYLSNNHTLSAIFDRDLSTPAQFKRRRQHILDLVMGYLTAPGE